MTFKLLLALAMSVIVLVGCGPSKDAIKETVAKGVEEQLTHRYGLSDGSVSVEVTNVLLVEEYSDRYIGVVEYKITNHTDSPQRRETHVTENRIRVTVLVDGHMVSVQWR